MRKKKKGMLIFLVLFVMGFCMMFAGSAMGAGRSVVIGAFGVRTEVFSSLFNRGNRGVTHSITAVSEADGVTAYQAGDGYIVVDNGNLPAFSQVHVNVVDMDVTVTHGDSYGIYLEYPEDRDIRWEIIRDVLVVYDDSASTRISIFGGSMTAAGWSEGGNVMIYCPSGTADVIKAETVSGDIETDALIAGQISLTSVSGDIWAGECYSARLQAETVSGNIQISFCEADGVELSSVSGGINANMMYGAGDYDLNFTTVSGDVNVNGERIRRQAYKNFNNPGAARGVSAETVSGDIDMFFEGN